MFWWTKEGSCSKNCSKEDSYIHYSDNKEMKDWFTYALGLILGFFVDKSPKGIVLCCDSSYCKSLVFSTHWKVLYTDKVMKNPMICQVSPDEIVRHCLMIPLRMMTGMDFTRYGQERDGEMNFVLSLFNI